MTSFLILTYSTTNFSSMDPRVCEERLQPTSKSNIERWFTRAPAARKFRGTRNQRAIRDMIFEKR